ncbi:hypothetical protein RI129_008332 [Pyrocoelia pectoralis]|uniref:Uncharacterized protein n=1 Tax=Pyrocoelia pectoralis TaxID=417401 RepID=A0AAN7V572_9COLE
MKLIHLIPLLAVLIQGTSTNGDPYTECLSETKVNEEDLHYITAETNTALDSKSGEYFLCVWKKVGIINDNGDVIREQFKEFIEDEIQQVRPVTHFMRQYVTATILECDLKREEVQEETAVKVKNCHTKIVVNALLKI